MMRILTLALAATFCSSIAAVQAAEPVQLLRVRMYVPTSQIPARLGDDASPLANYIKALQQRANEAIAEQPEFAAEGLLVAVVIKQSKQSRVWVQAIEGSPSAEIIEMLEKSLSEVEPIALKQNAVGFALEWGLFGNTQEKHPDFPTVWSDRLKAAGVKKPLTFDELAEIVWPSESNE